MRVPKKQINKAKARRDCLIFIALAMLLIFVNLQHILGSHEHVVPSLKTIVSNVVARVDTDIRECTRSEREFQALNRAGAKVRGCPPTDDIWMRTVHMHMPHAKVFIDIGSNKGYTAVRWFYLWSPELKVTPKSWHRILKSISEDQQVTQCGACSDCSEDSLPLLSISKRLCGPGANKTSDSRTKKSLSEALNNACDRREEVVEPITVFSFDGNKMLIEKCEEGKQVHDSKALGHHLESYWFLELTAFSDTYEEGKFLEFAVDGELGHIVSDDTEEGRSNDRGKKTISVPVSTVDHFVSKNNLEHIDFLKIDTEGHDANVILGALETLRAGKVTVMMFEYNTMWPEEFRDNSDPLQYIVEELEALNYVCYQEGKNVLLRLSFCWSPELSFRQWSNIWCVSANNVIGTSIISVFDSYSLAFI